MYRRVLFVVLSIVALLAHAIGHADGPDGNLLSNGGFEENTWYFQDGIQEIKIPSGWWAYWRRQPPDGLAIPSNCVETPRPDCYWARPEFKPVYAAEFANRVRAGSHAAAYFTVGRMHEAGLYQHVDGVPEGSLVRFSIWMMGWQCHDPDACQGGKHSDAPAHLHLQIGIDPNGGWDAWSPEIAWSPEQEAFDEWRLFQVEAWMNHSSTAVTVFTRSRAEWAWARRNNDIYVDEARLEVVSLPAVMSHAGLVSHTVAPGETVLLIAARYGTSPEAIAQANAFPPNFRLVPGQVIWIPPAGRRITGTLAVPGAEAVPWVATWPVSTPSPDATPRTDSHTDVVGAAVGLVLAGLVFAAARQLVRRYWGR